MLLIVKMRLPRMSALTRHTFINLNFKPLQTNKACFKGKTKLCCTMALNFKEVTMSTQCRNSPTFLFSSEKCLPSPKISVSKKSVTVALDYLKIVVYLKIVIKTNERIDHHNSKTIPIDAPMQCLQSLFVAQNLKILESRVFIFTKLFSDTFR